ncbi:MAG: 4Fe-4S dicluster domain-containing protein, partial [Hyphomicrobiaceae bacterium]
KLCSWACPYGAREYDYKVGVMRKCTLCVDRIYNENLPEEDRVPACVRACPTSARHFGDIGDPDSDVSKLVAKREGYDLMEDFGYKPTNKYLPPRARRKGDGEKISKQVETTQRPTTPGSAMDRLFAWADQKLSR